MNRSDIVMCILQSDTYSLSPGYHYSAQLVVCDHMLPGGMKPFIAPCWGQTMTISMKCVIEMKKSLNTQAGFL